MIPQVHGSRAEEPGCGVLVARGAPRHWQLEQCCALHQPREDCACIRLKARSVVWKRETFLVCKFYNVEHGGVF